MGRTTVLTPCDYEEGKSGLFDLMYSSFSLRESDFIPHSFLSALDLSRHRSR